MKHFALIGEHLGHSLSRPIHEAIYRRYGVDADYRIIEIPKSNFEQDAACLFSELDGFNVTIPYKERIMPLLNSMGTTAEMAGAVNTVVCTDRSGWNTDASGFGAMLTHFGVNPKGQPCFVLGTGGASKAVRAQLLQMGALSVMLVSRSKRDGVITYEELADHFSGILINTTPAGMWPDVNSCPISENMLHPMLKKATAVVDVIYNPRETLLTSIAHKEGVPAFTGLYMLVAQAVEAERLWLGIDFPESLTADLMKELSFE